MWEGTSARRMHSSIRIRRPLVPYAALHRGSTRWAACLEPFLVYKLGFWPHCVTLRTACVRVVACNHVMSRHSHESLPLTDRASRALRCSTMCSTSGVTGAWVQLHIKGRISSEFRTKYSLNRASGHHRSRLLGARSLRGGSMKAAWVAATWQRHGQRLWIIFLHVCASVFQLCTLLNNAARSLHESSS